MPDIIKDNHSQGGDKDKPKTEPEYEHTTPHENQPERSTSKK